MFKVKLITAITLLGILTGCSTTKEPTQEEEKKFKTAKINAQLGIAYLEQNNVQRAKQKLMLALEQAPTIPEPWYSMAYFYEATGNTQEAKEYYLKAIAVAPKRGDAHNNYGTFLCRNGEYKNSVQHFVLAVQDRTYLDPADAYENAGICALKIPDNERATHYFQQALAEDPSRSVSLIKLAELDYKAGDYKASEQHLSQFLNITTPTEQSIRLSKLLVLKTHSDAPTEEPIALAENTPLTVSKPLKVKSPFVKPVVSKPEKVVAVAKKPVKETKHVLAMHKPKTAKPKMLSLKKSSNKLAHTNKLAQKKFAKKKTHIVALNKSKKSRKSKSVVV